MTPFASRLERHIERHGPLCVGIDPSAGTLAKCDLPDSPEGAFELGSRVLHAVDHQLAIVKPQAAYFERFGSPGMRALEELIALARRNDVLVLLDAKRGDIDTTGEAYAEGFFSPASPLRVDAVTVHPYLGLGALEKLLAFAVRHGGGAFVVVRSSNPEGEAIQTARLSDGRSVAGALCDGITELNRRFGAERAGPIGAVVGATCHDAGATASALPLSYVLAPGVGAQGATIEDLRGWPAAARGRVLPSVSRGILSNGSAVGEIRSTLEDLKERARALRRGD